MLLLRCNEHILCVVHTVYIQSSIKRFKNVILPVFSRQNWCYDEFVLEFILFPTYQILSLLRAICWIQYYRSQ